MMTTVKPLASFLTVIRFSNEAMSWEKRAGAKITTQTKIMRAREKVFIAMPFKGKGCSACFQIQTRLAGGKFVGQGAGFHPRTAASIPPVREPRLPLPRRGGRGYNKSRLGPV